MFDLAEEFGTFRPSITDERFHILLETFHCVLHFGVEALCSHQALNKIVEDLDYLSVSGRDHVTLSIVAFVFRLLRPYPLILQQITVSLRQLFQERRLFVRCLQETVLVGPKFLKLCLKKLVLVICYRFFVEYQNTRYIVVVDFVLKVLQHLCPVSLD